MKISTIKNQAKGLIHDLPGKYQLFLIPIILGFINGGVSLVSNASLNDTTTESITAGLSFSIFPLILGLLMAYFTISALYTMVEVARYHRREVTMGDATRGFANDVFLKLLSVWIVRFILMTLWYLIPLTIGIFLTLIGTSNLAVNNNDTLGLGLVSTGIVFILAAVIILINRDYAYRMADLMILDQIKDGHYEGVLKAIKASSQLMKGHKFKLFLLDISFIGWFLLIPITFGLITFYVTPYYHTANAVFYKTISE